MKSKKPPQIKFQPLPKEEKGGQCFNCPNPAQSKVTWGDGEYFTVCCGNPICKEEISDFIERVERNR